MCGAPKSQTITQKTELDPNLQRLLYGGIFPGAPAAQPAAPAAPMSDSNGGGGGRRSRQQRHVFRRLWVFCVESIEVRVARWNQHRKPRQLA
jgi:hypothetical protein